jgi:hypothetical protein
MKALLKKYWWLPLVAGYVAIDPGWIAYNLVYRVFTMANFFVALTVLTGWLCLTQYRRKPKELEELKWPLDGE